MSNVFDEIYQEAFQNRLVKIAQDNNVDPNEFCAALEKIAASRLTVGQHLKDIGAPVGQSFKNLLEAVKGFGKVNVAKIKKMGIEKGDPRRYALGQEIAQGKRMEGKIGKSKLALGILGGTGVAGTAGTMALTSKK